MTHLGDFGKPIGKLEKTAQLDTIGLGTPPVKVRLNPAELIPMGAMMEFARLTSINMPAKSMAAQAVLYGALEGSIFEEDWPVARVAFLGMDDASLIQTCFALYERWAGAPLGGMDESTDGSSENPSEPSTSSNRSSRRAKARKASEPAAKKQADMEAKLGLSES